MTLQKKISESAAALQRILETCPKILVVLGSGFKGFMDSASVEKTLELSSIPHIPKPKVEGHGSQLAIATIGGHAIVVLTGRAHLYEGHSAHDVVHSIRSLARLGVKDIVLTNAAGGLNTKVNPGEVLLLEDQLNLTGHNCLCGEASELGAQFVDMTNAYDSPWRKRIAAAGLTKPGIYAGVLGPAYETPAETRMFAAAGANAVGMSTVQECLAARQLGLNVAGLSFVTNLAGGLSSDIDHEEVLALGKSKQALLNEVLTVAITTAPSRQ